MTLPLPTFIATVEAITPLPKSERGFAKQAWEGGIPPDRFARWLQLLASPSAVPPTPLGTGRMKDPREVHESLAGAQFEKEPA